MRGHEEEIEAAGARIVAIGLGGRSYARAFRDETGIEFPLLVDEDRKAYEAAELGSANLLHLLRKDNAKARARAKRQGHSQHKLGANPFQLGASFVFEPEDRTAYVHRSETFGDNAPVAELIAALAVDGTVDDGMDGTDEESE